MKRNIPCLKIGTMSPDQILCVLHVMMRSTNALGLIPCFSHKCRSSCPSLNTKFCRKHDAVWKEFCEGVEQEMLTSMEKAEIKCVLHCRPIFLQCLLGTRYKVPNISMIARGWLESSWRLYQDTIPDDHSYDLERLFFERLVFMTQRRFQQVDNEDSSSSSSQHLGTSKEGSTNTAKVAEDGADECAHPNCLHPTMRFCGQIVENVHRQDITRTIKGFLKNSIWMSEISAALFAAAASSTRKSQQAVDKNAGLTGTKTRSPSCPVSMAMILKALRPIAVVWV